MGKLMNTLQKARKIIEMFAADKLGEIDDLPESNASPA